MQSESTIEHIKKSFKEDTPGLIAVKIFRRITSALKLWKKELTYKFLWLTSKDGYLLKEIQGSKMFLDLRDKGICKELTFADIREEQSTIMIHKILKEGDVVFEIGANIGYYALIEAKLLGNKGTIYAIEPVHKNIELLKKNKEINNYNNIEIYELAISDKDGEAEMFLADKCNWHSMYKNKAQNITHTIKVKTLTLDSFSKDKKHPNLIRMDVEGFESSIIKGMEGILKQKKTLRMFIEIHPHIMEKNDLIEMLKTLKKYQLEIEMIAQKSELYNKTIDDLLNDELFLNGTKGAFEVFFCRQ